MVRLSRCGRLSVPVTIRHVKRLRSAAFALVLTGCGSSLTCHMVSCVSRASRRLYPLTPTPFQPLTAHACFDTRCADVLIDKQPRAAPLCWSGVANLR